MPVFHIQKKIEASAGHTNVSDFEFTMYFHHCFGDVFWGRVVLLPECICTLTCLFRYIVYDTAQVNLKYLLKLKFNYKGGLLW